MLQAGAVKVMLNVNDVTTGAVFFRLGHAAGVKNLQVAPKFAGIAHLHLS
jgi:hypothetical protein